MSAPRPRPAGGLLKEPLLWFAVLGFGLFGLDRLWPDVDPDAPVVVADATVVALVEGFTESQGRAPSDAEVAALVETHADELRALREARALGLDRADPVVRRRLLQKLDYLDAGALPEPDDAALQAFLDAHPERYARAPRTDGAALRLPSDTDAPTALAALAEGARPGSLGEPGPHPPAWSGLSAGQVADRTDPAVGAALAALPLDTWRPVPAGDRTWLVRVSARRAGGLPPLAEVWEAVRADWQAEARQRRLDAARQARRERWPTLRR